MTLPGATSYYLHRGIGAGAGSGDSGGAVLYPAFNLPTTFSDFSNPSLHQFHSNFSLPPAFNGEGPPAMFPMGPPTSVREGGAGLAVNGGLIIGNDSESALKKKRGRPRKYPDCPRTVSLGLSPSSSSTPNSNSPAEKKKRGRPPGSGRNQRLASVGEWMSSSAGVAFTPHIIYVAPGEDIASKVLSFSQLRQRAVCVMSASGGVSAVTLHRPSESVGSITYDYEGQFEILCLSGSYLVAETGGARNRTGGVNVSLVSPEGHLFGGSVAGRLIASRQSQVIICSFLCGNQNPRPKTKSDKDKKTGSHQHSGSDQTTETTANASLIQHMTPASVGWPASDAGTDLMTD